MRCEVRRIRGEVNNEDITRVEEAKITVAINELHDQRMQQRCECAETWQVYTNNSVYFETIHYLFWLFEN